MTKSLSSSAWMGVSLPVCRQRQNPVMLAFDQNRVTGSFSTTLPLRIKTVTSALVGKKSHRVLTGSTRTCYRYGFTGIPTRSTKQQRCWLHLVGLRSTKAGRTLIAVCELLYLLCLSTSVRVRSDVSSLTVHASVCAS